MTVTLFVIVFLIRNIGAPVSQLLFAPIFRRFDAALPSAGLGGLALDLASTLVVLCFITLLGALSNSFSLRILIGISESAINRIPGVGLVYRTVKQIVDTFSKQNKAVFQSVVMLEFPRRGSLRRGVCHERGAGGNQERTGEVVVNVFVPTTPNPTSGFLIMVRGKI